MKPKSIDMEDIIDADDENISVESMKEYLQYIIDNETDVDIDSEFVRIVEENFWNLLT